MFELFYLHGIITEEFTYQKEPLLYIHKWKFSMKVGKQ